MNIVTPKDIILSGGASEAIKYGIENPIIIGRVITETMLTTAVYEIDKAVSPLASLVITLDVTPPGQQARIMIPIAILSGREKAIAIINATNGRISI